MIKAEELCQEERTNEGKNKTKQNKTYKMQAQGTIVKRTVSSSACVLRISCLKSHRKNSIYLLRRMTICLIKRKVINEFHEICILALVF